MKKSYVSRITLIEFIKGDDPDNSTVSCTAEADVLLEMETLWMIPWS